MLWKARLAVAAAISVLCTLAPALAEPMASPQPLMQLMGDELDYSMAHLVAEDGTKPYFINYTVYDQHRVIIGATLGAIAQQNDTTDRDLNIDLRVGSYKLDNTHQLRGAGASHESGSGNIALALGGEPEAIRHALWFNTDSVFKDAARRFKKIKTNLKVKVAEEDHSDDFSRETSHEYYEPPARMSLDQEAWSRRLRKLSAIAREYPQIYHSSITLGAYAGTRYIVTSEGTRLQTSETRYRITLQAGTVADDGMNLQQADDFNARTPPELPSDQEIERAFRGVIDQVMALRSAPLAEPYAGPAILKNRASAVFFHEIFGHRMEGHRQKDVTEGQTFTKKVGKPVLPAFMSVYDDPRVAQLVGTDLRGFYRFDDEGVAAQRADLVVDGILKTFLMSRRPIEHFPKSNGHGRRQPGYAPVARQANLVVESKKQVPFDKLRQLLIEECKRQGKPYGLLFEDISGGFTLTTRDSPQSYKVLPIVVYRVYPDGRPDELIRGVDIVGTPLTSFAKITYTGDDPAVFNGSCGAESGWVPVSAVSPSILVTTIEIEKRERAQDRPPILPAPPSADKTQSSHAH